MSISPNTTLAHYTIISKIGAGGMGEVYRARDTRLDREVAIKLLPPEVSSRADRLQRFEQEAGSSTLHSHQPVAMMYLHTWPNESQAFRYGSFTATLTRTLTSNSHER